MARDDGVETKRTQQINTKESMLMIRKTDKEFSHGLRVTSIREVTKMMKGKGMGKCTGLMAQPMLETG